MAVADDVFDAVAWRGSDVEEAAATAVDAADLNPVFIAVAVLDLIDEKQLVELQASRTGQAIKGLSVDCSRETVQTRLEQLVLLRRKPRRFGLECWRATGGDQGVWMTNEREETERSMSGSVDGRRYGKDVDHVLKRRDNKWYAKVGVIAERVATVQKSR